MTGWGRPVTWTPVTSVTALFFGQDFLHGSFDLLSILFGLAVILLASLLAGSLATAFITYCLGPHPHPLAAAILGAACGLATEILLINLLCNWLQPENAIYNSTPSWAWWVGMFIWGSTLGVSLAVRGSGVGVAGPSPLLSADPYPDSHYATGAGNRESASSVCRKPSSIPRGEYPSSRCALS